MKKYICLALIAVVMSCGNDQLPKPKAFLRLDYPTPEYIMIESELPFSFEKNMLATDISKIKSSPDGKTSALDLEYPKLKGTIYLTYKKVDKDNLNLFLMDAQNITQKHTQKADAIAEQPFVNSDKRTYGMLYEVGGNAASQSQFYLTDSINHFVTGSLYFQAKPNYDSILPASEYLKNDIRHIMETLQWKE